MTGELDVFLDGEPVGTMRQTSAGSVTFRYDDGYRGRNDATPLSLSMPLTAPEHRNRVSRAFLAGLLPDSPGRLGELARQHRVSAANPFALLTHIGRDAAGAVQLLPAGAESDHAAQHQGDLDVLDDERLSEIVADIVANADTWGRRETGAHWSLPGAQPKIALFRTDDGRWAIPRDATPTTHILKPAVPPLSQHHVNEFVTMEAARTMGLDVADDFLLKTSAGDHVFVSTRYDRAERDGRWRRLHQEDLCQAMGLLPDKKYQQDGGPGIAQFADLLWRLPDLDDRRESARRFFEAIVFNVSALGTDAHAKNYSLLLSGTRARLAPLYDLGTHAPYPTPNGAPMTAAMSVRGEYRMAQIRRDDLVAAGARLSLDPDEARETVERIRGALVPAFHAAAEVASATLADETGFARAVADSVEACAHTRGWV